MNKFGEGGHTVFRVTFPFSREPFNSTAGVKLSIHFCADGDTIEMFFAQSFMWNNQQYLRSSLRCVWRIQCLSYKNRETCWDRTIWPTFRASRLVDNDTHILGWDSRTRKSFAEAQRTFGKASTTRSIDQDLYWCRIPEYSWSRTILYDKTYWRIFTFCRNSVMSWVHFPRDEKSTDQKGGIRGNAKIGPVLDIITRYLQTRSGNQNWFCEKKQFSLVGQNFWWFEQNGHRVDRRRVRRQRAGNFWNEDGSICVCKPIQGSSKTHQDLPLLAHLQGLYLFLKEHGLIDIERRAEFDQAHPVAKRINTLLRHREQQLREKRWSDRILETERWSSEQIW